MLNLSKDFLVKNAANAILTEGIVTYNHVFWKHI